VRTGTILFTVFHRVAGTADENVWGNDRKLDELKQDLVVEGTQALADLMVHKLRRLSANSQAYWDEVASTQKHNEHVRREQETTVVKPIPVAGDAGSVTPMGE